MEWLDGNKIQIIPPKRPKKLTGTRFATILGLNPWSTPFEIWCEVTRTYQKPFEDTIYTIAGKTIEPTLFIEFGTGVTYPDDHPEAEELGMKRGEYGQGHGKQHSWGYYGDPGTNGVLKEKKNGGFVVITHGNPANMPMYETVKELQDRLTEIAKEVFS